ncbi:tripartite tricarboxylate transporter substrate binding protein [Pigmentiphaga sp. H8]|uniref:Bug family tripartite tricarboxylate transporter substrate binding protein n=1 Tax=Pigmentiphaga sp. H8 TaxID=2488560 RepID=UPI000F5B79E7|nr:tripartite tricarboxylate transporter substrate binding protein [Pigmentiphaga sp. H8]AZG07858.1 tripartite tricarboxylate transporter substrate binding protein [Pigmentiphaga sp. H8]
MKHRWFHLTWACALAVAAAPAHAQSQSWPDKAIRIVLPGPPGSSPDRITRLLADHLNKKWKQPVVVENRPGGTTRIGAEIVARAAPDGYTLLSTFVSHGMVKLLYPETPYDPIKDFTPVAQLVDTETVFVVRADSPYKTLAQLVEGVKTRGKPLGVGNFGTGSSFHFYSLILGQGAGMEVLPVPYKGEALSLADMLGGHVESSFNSVGTALPHIREGKVRALAVLAPKRSKVLPEVPTFTELGFPRLREGGWFGILAPAGTPRPIIDKLHADIQTVLRDPEVTAWLRNQGLEPAFVSADAFGQSMQREAGEWAKLIKEFNVSVN